MAPEDLFLDLLPHIKKVVAHLCRRYYFRKEEHEDFLSHVQVKFIEDDYAVLRKFQGRSSPKTYVTTVVGNLLRDYQNHLWGKWRPSAEAERLGPVAILLERLLVREGYSFDQAVQTLQINHRVEMSWQELADMAARLPSRSSRHIEGEEGIRDLPAPGERADDRVLGQEREAALRKLLEALEEARKILPEEDRLILKMQGDGFSIADIARTLRLEQKQLYRRIQKILKQLREELERRGFRKEDLDGIFDD
jgi:RNA polymerase sigma factor (sigma-70 family)